LARKSLQSLGFSCFGQHCFQGFDWVFETFPLRISNATN
jgi:hypothetical protein